MDGSTTRLSNSNEEANSSSESQRQIIPPSLETIELLTTSNGNSNVTRDVLVRGMHTLGSNQIPLSALGFNLGTLLNNGSQTAAAIQPQQEQQRGPTAGVFSAGARNVNFAFQNFGAAPNYASMFLQPQYHLANLRHQANVLSALNPISPPSQSIASSIVPPSTTTDIGQSSRISNDNYEQRHDVASAANASAALISGTGAVAAVAAAADVVASPSATPGIVLSLDQDEIELSPYQCLARKQIEIFEQPDSEEIRQEHTQGRNRPVIPGQVGIRCRHCGTAAKKFRSRGSILFPSTLLGIYQTAQNMINTHFLRTCKLIPKEVRQDLIDIRSTEKGRQTCKSAYGGGRQYWADSCQVLGVVDTPERRLVFASSSTGISSRSSSQMMPSSTPPPATAAAKKTDDDEESDAGDEGGGEPKEGSDDIAVINDS